MPAPMRKVPRAHYSRGEAAAMSAASASGGLGPLTRVARPTRLAPLESHATSNLLSLQHASIPHQLSAIRPPPRMTMPPVR